MLHTNLNPVNWNWRRRGLGSIWGDDLKLEVEVKPRPTQ